MDSFSIVAKSLSKARWHAEGDLLFWRVRDATTESFLQRKVYFLGRACWLSPVASSGS